MISLIKNKLPLVLLLCYCLFLTLPLLASGGLIIHGDVKFPWNIQNFIQGGAYLFSDHNGNISGLEVIGRWNTMTPIASIVQDLGLGTDSLVKALFVLTTLASLFIFYFFSKWITESIIKENYNPYFGVLIAIFFTSNPWILNQIQAWGYWLAYITTPIIIYCAFNYFLTLRLYYLLLLIITISSISAGPQYLIFTFILLVVMLLAFCIKINTRIIKSWLFYAHIITGLVIFILLSLPWLYTVYQIFQNGLPMTTGYGQGSADLTREMVFEFAKNASIINILTGFDQWISWFNDDIKYLIQRILIFIPLILTLGVLVSIKYKYLNKVAYGFLISILSIFITFLTLTYGPNIPGYVDIITSPIVASTIGFVFRTTNKLSYFIFIGYAIVLIYGYAVGNRKTKIIIFISILIYFICVPLVKSLAYYWKYYMPVETPNYYVESYKYLESIEVDKNSKIIWLAPYSDGWNKNKLKWETSFTWNPERNSTHTPETSSVFTNISWYHLTYKNWVSLYKDINYFGENTKLRKDIGRIIGFANVKYLVFHNDIIGAEAAGFSAIDFLMNETDLTYLNSFEDVVYIFENPYVKPIVYTLNNDQISIEKINPTSYKLTGVLSDNYLYFAQIYDPFWILYINGRRFEPEKDAITGLVKYNVTGITEFSGKIDYFPQKYYERGIAISTIIFPLAIMILLMIKFSKGRNLNKE